MKGKGQVYYLQGCHRKRIAVAPTVKKKGKSAQRDTQVGAVDPIGKRSRLFCARGRTLGTSPGKTRKKRDPVFGERARVTNKNRLNGRKKNKEVFQFCRGENPVSERKELLTYEAKRKSSGGSPQERS